jgi:hypothetical protein
MAGMMLDAVDGTEGPRASRAWTVAWLGTESSSDRIRGEHAFL